MVRELADPCLQPVIVSLHINRCQFLTNSSKLLVSNDLWHLSTVFYVWTFTQKKKIKIFCLWIFWACSTSQRKTIWAILLINHVKKKQTWSGWWATKLMLVLYQDFGSPVQETWCYFFSLLPMCAHTHTHNLTTDLHLDEDDSSTSNTYCLLHQALHHHHHCHFYID